MSLNPGDSTFAGMLAKMISLPFGRSRWASRYFVLLDSELRLYKDPHTETPSQILNLRQVSQVIPASQQRPFCLELKNKNKQEKAWIIDCGSEKVMEDWFSAIQSRIVRHTNSLPNTPNLTDSTSRSNSDINPSKNEHSRKAINSYCSIQQVDHSPEIYRLPTLPLRCTNLTSVDRSNSITTTTTTTTLLKRRNKELSPLIIHDDPFIASCSNSPVITTPSPTGAVIGASYLIDEYCYSYKAGSTVENNIVSVESSSPTYLSYKKRFGL